jgi:NAD-dependent DNA ligase
MMRENSLYEIDGVVFEYDEYSKRKELGFHESSRNPKFAFKWKTRAIDNIAQSLCIGVEWNMSKHLYWKPTVLIEATELCGITVQRLSGFNAKFIKDNGIGIGAIIEFTRAGDVIPHILAVSNPVEWSQPLGEWVWSESEIDAISLDDSDDAQLLKLLHFAQSLEVESLKEGTMLKLMADGHDGILDIVNLPREYWSDRIGRNGEKAYDSLHAKLQDIYLWELIGSWPYFGRGLGKRRAKQITDALGESCINATVEQLIAIPGFQEKTAQTFLGGLDRFVESVNWLLERKFIKFKKEEEVIEQKTGKLTGEKFVFTGFRSSELEEKIVKLGGELQDKVKKDTTYLVVKDLSKTSNKTKQAEELNIKIVDPLQLEELLK